MKKKQPQLVTLAILTTVTVVLWVFYSLYEVLAKPVEVSVGDEIVFPLDPNLDTQTLNSLESKIYFSENQTIPLPIKSQAQE